MAALKKWFERKFFFDFGVGVFPAVLERLRGTPARLEEKLESIPPHLITRRLNNDWSIQEHVGHLYDLEELWDGRVDDFIACVDVMRPADMANKKTHEADHNSKPIRDLLDQFRSSRERLVARLEMFDDKQIENAVRHPRLDKPMRVVDMVFFIAEHDDHHLVLMTELAGILSSRE